MNPLRREWPVWAVMGGSVALSLLVALLDFLTGAELSFSIFYVGPVGLAAWQGSRRAGIALAVWSGILWLTADLTSGRPYSAELIPYWNALVRLGFFLIIALLLTSLRRTLDLVQKQASLDALTGLPNARRLRELVELELGRMRRYRRPLTLAYLDLDNFKAVNDTRGHAEGDRLLQEVSREIRRSVRETDWVARLGGDEFCILLPETGEEGAGEGLRKVREGVLALARAEEWPISLSMGAVTFLEAPASTDEAIGRADRLMYQVKKGGKDAILQEVVSVRTALESQGGSGS